MNRLDLERTEGGERGVYEEIDIEIVREGVSERGRKAEEKEEDGREGDKVNTVYVNTVYVYTQSRILRYVNIKLIYRINHRVHT